MRHEERGTDLLQHSRTEARVKSSGSRDGAADRTESTVAKVTVVCTVVGRGAAQCSAHDDANEPRADRSLTNPAGQHGSAAHLACSAPALLPMRTSLALIAATAAALLLACASGVQAQLPPRSEHSGTSAAAEGTVRQSSGAATECMQTRTVCAMSSRRSTPNLAAVRSARALPRQSSLTDCVTARCLLCSACCLLLRLGFCVSSSPSVSPRTCDVVSDGVVQGNWTAAVRGQAARDQHDDGFV